MLHRRTLVILLLALSLVPPLVAGVGEESKVLLRGTTPPAVREEYVDVAPRSGKYLDFVTSSVYYFDATTHTLTPTGERESLIQYAEIDVYRRGERADIRTPTTEANPTNPHLVECNSTICISAVVALTGGHTITIDVGAIPSNLDCRQLTASKSTTTAPPVTFYDTRLAVNPCAPGTAFARLFVDGVQADADTTTYGAETALY